MFNLDTVRTPNYESILTNYARLHNWFYTTESLFKAIENNDKIAVENLINAHPNIINAIHYKYRCNALLFAIDQINYDMVHLLLNNGADPNQGDVFYTPAIQILAHSLEVKLAESYAQSTLDINYIAIAERIMDLLFCHGYRQSERFKPDITRVSLETGRSVHLLMKENSLKALKKLDGLLANIGNFLFFLGRMDYPVSFLRHYFLSWWRKQEEVGQQLSCISGDAFVDTTEIVKREKTALLFSYKREGGLNDRLPDALSDVVLEYLELDIANDIAEKRFKENRHCQFKR